MDPREDAIQQARSNLPQSEPPTRTAAQVEEARRRVEDLAEQALQTRRAAAQVKP